MPVSKYGLTRLFIIVRELQKATSLSPINKEWLQDAIREEMGYQISLSMLEKDIAFLRHDSSFGIFAPIKSIKGSAGGYYMQSDWKLSEEIAASWRI